MFTHVGGHGRNLILAATLQIRRSIVGTKIAPALKRPARHGANGHERRVEQKQAGGRTVLLGAVLEADETLAHKDRALDHPVQRAPVKQFRLPLRRLERRVIDARSTIRRFAAAILFLPIGKVLKR